MRVLVLATVILVLSICLPAAGDGSYLVVDGHNHDALSASDGLVDVSGLARLRTRGIDVVVVPMPLNRSDTSDLEGRIASEMIKLRRDPKNESAFTIASPDELLQEGRSSGVGLLFSVEWFGGIFDGDARRVKRLRDLGIRIIGLPPDDPDDLFGVGDQYSDLTPFGERIVSALNQAGVLIDITHVSHSRKLEIIRRSRVPVVATHSLSADVCAAPSNLPGEVVAGLAESGGSVWVSFNSSELLSCDCDGDAIELVVDHIEGLMETLGTDRVGIGTDLQAGGRYVPPALNRDGAFSEIGRRLSERGHSEQVVEGILGRNVLRALATQGDSNDVFVHSSREICRRQLAAGVMPAHFDAQ